MQFHIDGDYTPEDVAEIVLDLENIGMPHEVLMDLILLDQLDPAVVEQLRLQYPRWFRTGQAVPYCPPGRSHDPESGQ